MQDYLKPNTIPTFKGQIKIFSYRSEMHEFHFNFRGLRGNEIFVCTNQLINPHIFQCRILNGFKGHELNYRDILNGTLHQQKKILNIMKKNIPNYRKISLAARAKN